VLLLIAGFSRLPAGSSGFPEAEPERRRANRASQGETQRASPAGDERCRQLVEPLPTHSLILLDGEAAMTRHESGAGSRHTIPPTRAAGASAPRSVRDSGRPASPRVPL